LKYDPRIPDREACVLRPLLDRRARETPDKIFVVFEDGESWTYAELRRRVRVVAGSLAKLGVRQDDFVLSWLPNGPDALLVWFGLNYLGAVYVPVNTGYRGHLLEHVIANSDARLMIADGRLVDRLAGLDLAALQRIVHVGAAPVPSLPNIEFLPEAVLADGDGTVADSERPIMPWDTQTVIYTSGTTGPSKGVLSSYLQLYSTASAFYAVTADDRNMASLPLFHAGGTGAIYRMLVKGGSTALVESFRTQTFWETVRRTQTTTITLLGAMIPFLLKEPPSPRDRDHPLRHVVMVPLSDDAQAFTDRFGVDVYTTFNMTETSCPIVSERNPRVRGTCGRPRPGVEARVVDDNDCEVAPGEIGQLILRTDMPWAMNHGYHKNPQATAQGWRNGWFHTGDAFRYDADGNFFFVDRLKDAIRRRGENISSFEVEAEIGAHPAVREAAVVAVPSEFGEDEVLAVVSPVPGSTVEPAALIDFLVPRLAHFMVPRFVRVVDDLPRTPTQKVQKHLLRSEGVTADTWDREKAGIVLKREKLSTTSRLASDTKAPISHAS
jgi:crotonobetaine/carnitine-CoA ligase